MNTLTKFYEKEIITMPYAKSKTVDIVSESMDYEMLCGNVIYCEHYLN